jgi:hypothetical protein
MRSLPRLTRVSSPMARERDVANVSHLQGDVQAELGGVRPRLLEHVRGDVEAGADEFLRPVKGEEAAGADGDIERLEALGKALEQHFHRLLLGDPLAVGDPGIVVAAGILAAIPGR